MELKHSKVNNCGNGDAFDHVLIQSEGLLLSISDSLQEIFHLLRNYFGYGIVCLLFGNF